MNPYAAPAATPLPHPSAGVQLGFGAAPNAGVTEVTASLLRQTSPWVRLISVLMFLGSGLMVLGGVGVIAVALTTKDAMVMALLGVVYVPLGGVYVYPAVKLWMYANAIGRLLLSGSVFDLEAALAEQKHFWKFAGIGAIALVLLYVLAIAAMGVMGFLKATGHT